MSKLNQEIVNAGIPAMSESDGRVALGPPYKTPTGQWVALAGGGTEWCGTGEPTPAPDQDVLDTIASVLATHVPDDPPVEPPDMRVVLRALVKAQRSVALSTKESDALDAMENWE